MRFAKASSARRGFFLSLATLSVVASMVPARAATISGVINFGGGGNGSAYGAPLRAPEEANFFFNDKCAHDYPNGQFEALINVSGSQNKWIKVREDGSDLPLLLGGEHPAVTEVSVYTAPCYPSPQDWAQNPIRPSKGTARGGSPVGFLNNAAVLILSAGTNFGAALIEQKYTITICPGSTPC